jgi:protein SYS1
MTVLGVWTCQYRELKPISFGFGSTASHINLGEAHHDAARGADGAGDYEMVGMDDGAEQV